MTFKPDSNKQAQKVEKHLDIHLNGKSDLHEHLQNIFKKVRKKTISLLRKLQNNLPKAPSYFVYKATLILFIKDLNRFNILQHLP